MSNHYLFSSEKLLDILALTPLPTAIHTGEDMFIQSANDAMIAVWGKDRSVIGKGLLAALPELVGQPFMDLFVGVWRTGITYRNFDTPAVLEINGKLQTTYFDFEYRALKDENGKVYAILHTASDVTERYLTRQALDKAAQQEEQLHKEQAINEELAASNEEIVAVNEELLQTQHRLQALNEELAASNEEIIAVNEELIQTQDNLQALNNELEVRVAQRTQALADSEARFRFMLNAIPQQVWTAAPDGRLDYVNQVVCNDFGYSTEEIVGHGWQKFIHPDDLTSCLEQWITSLQTGADYMIEFRLMFSDGLYRWHLTRAIPLIENGEITMWIGTNTNIDLQKNNEQKKDEFLSIASHELKTPLTSIKAFNQLMQRAGDLDKMSNFAKKSADHILRLERLIADLLDVTKINAGKMNYNMEPFNFKQMLKESIESVQHISPKHKIIVENLVDIIFTGDHFRLEQVVQNFLSNAIKYSPDADKIIVNSRIEQGNIIVSVQDFGIGIEPDNLDKLFDRYYRVDNTAMRFEGLGLGLFISSEILKGHQGSFWIESKPDEGSIFYFRLPIDPDKTGKPLSNTDTYFKNSNITVNYNKEADRIDTDWYGFHNLETVKAGCMVMLEITRKNNCKKIINDNRHVLGTWSEASEWVGTSFFPMLENAGVAYLAWVIPSNMFSQLSAKKSVDVAVGNVITQFFTDISLAEEWIAGV